MFSTLLFRAAVAIATVFFVLTAVFFVVRWSGDPTSYLLPLDYTPEQRDALRRELGVDKPMVQQYGIFLRDAAGGDLGDSHRWRQAAMPMVFDALPNTIRLALCAFGLSLLVSIPLGTLAAARRGTPIDSIVGAITTTGQALPHFLLAVILVWFVSVELRWLPVGGMGGPKNYILPAITLAAYPIASQTRIVRSAVADTLSQDFIRTARAKGLSPTAVLVRHALRPSMVPILTILGIQWSYFLGGSVVVETIFAWPGVGRLMADAIAARDYAVVQSGIVVMTSLVVVTNLCTDFAYTVADPRYRLGAKT